MLFGDTVSETKRLTCIFAPNALAAERSRDGFALNASGDFSTLEAGGYCGGALLGR